MLCRQTSFQLNKPMEIKGAETPQYNYKTLNNAQNNINRTSKLHLKSHGKFPYDNQNPLRG